LEYYNGNADRAVDNLLSGDFKPTIRAGPSTKNEDDELQRALQASMLPQNKEP
jgi:hypothetical protein